MHGGSRCDKHPVEKRHGSAGKRKTGRAGVIDRHRVMRRDDGLCQECLLKGVVTMADHVDHIVPLSAGGSDEDSNKRCLCVACHAEKSREDRGGEKVQAPNSGHRSSHNFLCGGGF